MDLHESSRDSEVNGPPGDTDEESKQVQGGEPDPQPGSAAPAPDAGEEPGAGSGEVMGKLPHSRPRRQTPRSKPAARARAQSSARRQANTPRRSASAGRRSPAAGGRTAGGKGSGGNARATRARSVSGRPAGSSAVFAAKEPAPGLPRLAFEGALEAAKLPIKVGAQVTFRALDAVARSLRR